MSKIYDALRKAENEKNRKRATPARGRPPSRKIDAHRDSGLLRGMDENFRRALLTLRNTIESETKERNTRSIVFTSAVGGEGKTTILSAFARVLSIGRGERILLVDCSIRKPKLHKLFDVDNDKGIIDYLEGRAELPEIVHHVESAGLDLVTAGFAEDVDISMPVFNSERMTLFMREVSEAYEYVLFDTAAVLEAPETPIISSYSDGVIMIVHVGKTRREVIKRAMLMIEKLEGRFIGTILNRKKYHIPEFIYRRV
ncbi:MAG TPA: tyrosine-protein kinase family protein [Candidatus Eisenbacteria bacterium]|uniref:non-specific protein-tyrosine kinase n=1 Tax=Eiseniibacteriota bacterium TaxID=2212470 RepID=A0A7V2AUL0_UNCEI|nr:tyrosine-protein kinase family protein [Candidatus Eisenbacteria bacterium]